MYSLFQLSYKIGFAIGISISAFVLDLVCTSSLFPSQEVLFPSRTLTKKTPFSPPLLFPQTGFVADENQTGVEQNEATKLALQIMTFPVPGILCGISILLFYFIKDYKEVKKGK